MLGRLVTKARTVLALAGILAITASACQAAAPTNVAQQQYADGGTVTIRLLADWATLDPGTTAFGSRDRALIMGVYDRLLAIGPKNELIPYVAKSWQTTDTTVTFTLRNDVKCADGTPLTPTAVANSFKRLFDPATKYPSLLSGYGPGPYLVVADDQSSTVKFTFAAPSGPRIYQFADDAIICPAGLANPSALSDSPQGSGPYKIESAVHNDKLVMSLRPEWNWGPANTTAKTKGLPSKLVFQIVGNDTTAANLMVTGGLDFGLMTGPDVPRLQADKSLNVQQTHNFITFWVGFNETPGLPTADPAVRAALMHAFDGKAFNQVANFGYGGTPSTSFLVDDANCFDPETAKILPPFNIETAKQKLIAAGYTMGPNGKLQKDGKPLTLTTLGQPALGAGPEYVLTQLNAVGATATINATDRTVFAANLLAGKWDVTIVAGVNALPDPTQAARYFSGPPPTAGSNFGRISDPELEREVAAAQGKSGAEACKHWVTVQRLILQKSHFVPLAAPNYYFFARGFDFVPFSQAVELYSIRRRG